jgi:hypothetical protein
MENDLIKRIQKLEEEVERLKTRRVGQTELLPGCVKARNVSEGIKYIQSGLVADLPVVDIPMQGQQFFWATDTHTLYIYDGSAWRTQILT